MIQIVGSDSVNQTDTIIERSRKLPKLKHRTLHSLQDYFVQGAALAFSTKDPQYFVSSLLYRDPWPIT